MKAGIVGAGILGRLLAYQLHQQGWQVSLFDQGNANTINSSLAAAGLLTPLAELEHSPPIIFEMGLTSLEKHWPEIISNLDPGIFFSDQGSLVLAHPKDKNELTRFVQRIEAKTQNHQLHQKLNSENISALEPEITQFENAYLFLKEGRVDNQHLFTALETYFENNQINYFQNTFVEKVQAHKITVNQSDQLFDCVFDCRGLSAKAAFPELRGVRGELIWVQAPEVSIQHQIRFLHPRYRLYVAPRPNHIYIVGASEIESEDFSEITVKTTLELLSALYSLHPGFAEAKILKTVTQCRPALNSHTPKIKYCEGLVAINGLYRHGYLIGPALVNEVIRWTQQGTKTLQYPQLWEAHHDYN